MKTIHIAIGILLILLFYDSTLNALCVRVTTANLRTGPGIKYEIGWTVHKYMPFKIVGKSTSGEWYAVEDVDNAVLWIHKSLLTSKYNCAVVNVKIVNVRTGPGTNYSKRFSDSVDGYYSAKIINKKGPWIKVVDEDNAIGWIHKDYIWVQ
jgi:SH3-like domain-containing protein